uniref:G-protein coupled receptors family 1 profile domain-containing protein n=1 Tax=Zonotrichia albicollis TaxID=44394 RepID=A0A8D2N7B0_ZONAL
MDPSTGSDLNSPALDTSRAIIVGLILGAFILFAIIGNILVILSVACNRHLRIPTNYFIVNLAIADLLLSFTVLPFSATLEVLGYWVLGRIFCDIWAAVDVLCCTASILSLCAISIDRYIGVRYSLQYPTLVTRRRAILALLAVWVLSMVISIGPLLGWKEPAPQDDRECRITEEPFYALFSSLGSFYIPLIVILVISPLVPGLSSCPSCQDRLLPQLLLPTAPVCPSDPNHSLTSASWLFLFLFLCSLFPPVTPWLCRRVLAKQL